MSSQERSLQTSPASRYTRLPVPFVTGVENTRNRLVDLGGAAHALATRTLASATFQDSADLHVSGAGQEVRQAVQARDYLAHSRWHRGSFCRDEYWPIHSRLARGRGPQPGASADRPGPDTRGNRRPLEDKARPLRASDS